MAKQSLNREKMISSIYSFRRRRSGCPSLGLAAGVEDAPTAGCQVALTKKLQSPGDHDIIDSIEFFSWDSIQ